VPSAVSAIKVDGQRAYARVRAGEDVVLAPRRVRISEFDLHELRPVSAAWLDLTVSVQCSSGTYVRAIARDLGAALGVGGHLTALRRTRVGEFTLADCRSLEELAERDDPVTVDLDAAVARSFPRRDVDAAQAQALAHGGRLPAVGIDGSYGVFGPDGAVVALVEERGGVARPVTVLRPAG
jgi:tRNA pseudouridine55 synthase